MSEAKFKTLLSPIQVGTQTVSNRIMASPAGAICFCPDGKPDTEMLFFNYDKLAKSGAAQVILGETPINLATARGDIEFYDFSKTDDEHLKPFKDITEHFKSLGVKVLIELCHVGNAKIGDPSEVLLGPMEFDRADGTHVRAMAERDIEETCNDFSNAAYFMKLAGFDGIVLHAGHGWLFTQFLSPRTNQRTDKFGGSLENRSRITTMVLASIRDRCGSDFMVQVRISGSEHTEGGYGVEDVCGYAKYISQYCDLIQVSAGLYRNPMRTWMISTIYDPHGCNSEISGEIKKAVDIPVAVVGGISDPLLAEDLILKGKADLVMLGRALKADHDWGNKVINGQADEVKQCIRCMRCFLGSIEEAFAEGESRHPGCTINPYELHRDLEGFPSAKNRKKVLIVGGGIGGMQAAQIASERGHQVLLVEKSARLGGTLNYAEHDPAKYDLYKFARTMELIVNHRGIDIRLNTVLTKELIEEFTPSEIIAAIGASSLLPHIPGLQGPNVLTAMEAYQSKSKVGERVVVLGGGLVGCEIAIHLARSGRKVTLIEMKDGLGTDGYRLYRHKVNDLIQELVTPLKGTRCVSVTPTNVIAERKNGAQFAISADTVVVALGMKANPTKEIQRLATEFGTNYYEIGDCVRPRKIFDAVEEGFMTAIGL